MHRIEVGKNFAAVTLAIAVKGVGGGLRNGEILPRKSKMSCKRVKG